MSVIKEYRTVSDLGSAVAASAPGALQRGVGKGRWLGVAGVIQSPAFAIRHKTGSSSDRHGDS